MSDRDTATRSDPTEPAGSAEPGSGTDPPPIGDASRSPSFLDADDPSPVAPPDAGETEAFIAHVPLFASLPNHARRELAAAARWVHLPGGHHLFHQGDVADALALVWSGRLEVVEEQRDEQSGATDEQVISVLGRGAWVGELSLLTGAPRSAAIRARRDSQLIIVPAAAFERVVEREPELGLAMARVLAQQLQRSAKTPAHPPPPDTLALIPMGDALPLEPLLRRVELTLGAHGSVAVLDGPPDTAAGSALDPSADGRERSWADHLDGLEAAHPWVVLAAPAPEDDPAWTSFCVRSADRVLALVRGGKPPPWAVELLGGNRADVVFVGSSLNASRMTPTLTALRPRTHHHLPEGRGLDGAADRVARRASGHALGVVFSGGGARGLAHIGVIERLVDAGVPIDRVGGCSAGAFASALLAMGRTPAEMLEIGREEFVERRPFGDFGVPREGLIKGKRARAMLLRVFGDTRIEELSLSMFAVSADLASGELVVHRTGLVRDAVAASMSLPGVAPPIAIGGHLLVDGGILDNFPVDVMRDMDEGPVVGVDVMREFPVPDPGSARGLKELAGPGIVSTLARSMVLGGWQRAQQNRRLADVLISPAVDAIGMFEFDRMDEAVDAGRRAADAALARGALVP